MEKSTSFFDKIKVEHIFIVLGLFFGLKFVFNNAPWQTNDEDRHFYNAWYLSQGYIGPEQQGDKIGRPMPTNLLNTVQSFQGIRYSNEMKIPKSKIKELERAPLSPNETTFYNNTSYVINPVPYIPAAIAIKIGGWFKNSPVWLGWWGRIGALLAYLIITFFAIRLIPSYKSFVALFALSPMALFQGASVTYDTLNFAFIFLMLGYTFKLYVQESPITTKQMLLYVLLCVIQNFAKDGYFILTFVFFLNFPSKFLHKRDFYLGFALVGFAVLLPKLTWEVYLNSLHLKPGTPGQNDFKFNTGMNLAFHLKDPIHAVSLYFQNLLIQTKEWIIGAFGRFGYSYTPLPEIVIFLQFFVLAGFAILSGNKFAFKTKEKIGLVTLGLLNAGMIIAGFFLISPIGASVIFGIQGRYFTPVFLFLILGGFSNTFFKVSEDKLKWFMLIYVMFTLMYTSTFLSNTFFS